MILFLTFHLPWFIPCMLRNTFIQKSNKKSDQTLLSRLLIHSKPRIDWVLFVQRHRGRRPMDSGRRRPTDSCLGTFWVLNPFVFLVSYFRSSEHEILIFLLLSSALFLLFQVDLMFETQGFDFFFFFLKLGFCKVAIQPEIRTLNQPSYLSGV